jgi:translation initiation factor 1
MGKRDKPPPPPPSTPFHSGFAKLRDRLPAGWVPPEPQPAPGASDTGSGSGSLTGRPQPAPARAVVRLERKGRAGKEATVVEKLALPPEALAAWADALKRSLGCGGGVEDDAIVLQGDQRGRARAFLEGRGVRKVTVA